MAVGRASRIQKKPRSHGYRMSPLILLLLACCCSSVFFSFYTGSQLSSPPSAVDKMMYIGSGLPSRPVLPSDLRLATLTCDTYGGPSAEFAQEMVSGSDCCKHGTEPHHPNWPAVDPLRNLRCTGKTFPPMPSTSLLSTTKASPST